MITTLDRYIIGKFLSTFFFSLLICTLITVAIDFSDKVQKFIERPCTLREILIDYYPGFIMHMAGLLLPLYTLIAVVFFTSRLAFNSEIISVLNAGVSFTRLMRPYLIAGGIIAGLHLLLSHELIPLANKRRLDFEHKYIWTNSEKVLDANAHFMVAADTKVFIRSYDKHSKTARNLRLEQFADNKIISILEARQAEYKEDIGKWQLTGYSGRSFDGMKETLTRENTGKLDTAINLTPQDFISFNNQNEEMTTRELLQVIARDRSRGQSNTKHYEIELHKRTAEAFTIMILTVIGLSVAGRKVRGGMGLHLAMGIGIGALFILLSKFAASFAASGSVPVLLGMWLPNLFFLIIAIYLSFKAQK